MGKKTNVCRVCLDSKHHRLKSLFDKYKNIVLYEFINTLTNIKIKSNDGLPDKICNSCYIQLKTSINFKEKCEESDLILKKGTIKVEVVPEEQGKFLVKNEESEENVIKIENYNDDNFGCPLGLESETEKIKEEKNNEECFDYPVEMCNEMDDMHTLLIEKSDLKSRAIDLKLECHDCGDIFKSKCKLKVHWKKTHMLPSLICIQCKRAFKSYKAFHLHRKKKTKSCIIASDDNVFIEGVGRTRTFACKQCNYRSKRLKDMSAHLVIHSGDRPYQCNICSKTYTQLSSLQGHQESAHQKYIVEITCHYCGKYVKGRRKVHRHLVSHTKIECTVCHKKISKLGFQVHMKRHSGIKSYACEKCASTFYTTSELCNHKRLVHSKKSFKCDLCDYTTVKANCLKSHRSKHTNKNLPCTVCGRFFITADKLASHQRTHYAEKKFSCPRCDARFFKRDSVRRHLKVKHFIERSEQKSTVFCSERPLIVKTESVCLPQTEPTE